jgi:hypothetical protein
MKTPMQDTAETQVEVTTKAIPESTSEITKNNYDDTRRDKS